MINMKCEKCNKNDATTHYTQNINGQVTEMHLCGECAETAGFSFGGFAFKPFNSSGWLNPFGPLGSFGSDFFPGFSGDFAPLSNMIGALMPGSDLYSDKESTTPTSAEPLRCPVCGRSFDEIAQTGRLGCAKCYETFRGQLRGSIARLHGSSSHTGKRPGGRVCNDEDIAGKISNLKTQLSQAIAVQEYEKCAELRDEIKRLEKVL